MDNVGFITFDSNGDGNSDDNCHILDTPTEDKVPEKRPRIGGMPPNPALDQAAANVGTAMIKETLSKISSSVNETPGMDTTPIMMPVKSKTKRKKKAKKRSDRSKVSESSESNNPRTRRLEDQLLEDQIKEER